MTRAAGAFLAFLGIALLGSLADVDAAHDESRGVATWYDDPNREGLYAAVNSYRWGDPTYRVRVTATNGRSVVVTVGDYCGCRGERAIDLSPTAFARLAPLSRGVVRVTVAHAVDAAFTLPPTSTRGSLLAQLADLMHRWRTP